MKIIDGNLKENIQQAAKIIRDGGVVVFPTETVYGLGADALSPRAVTRIFEVKKRPHFDPLIVHIADEQALNQLCSTPDDRAFRLIRQFWPGPLTLVLPKTDLVPDIVTAGLSTVAVRMPNHPIAQQFIQAVKTPIAAPSANLFGHLSPTTAEHAFDQLGDRVDLILDGGKCSVGVESTIVSFIDGEPTLLRAGGIALEDIEQLIGKIRDFSPTSSARPLSPGQLPSHYAPITALKIGDYRNFHYFEGRKIGLLAFKTPPVQVNFETIEVLSPTGDLREAAANFFTCLHKLDKAKLDLIIAEPVPEIGLGRAIMDRLRRAAV